MGGQIGFYGISEIVEAVCATFSGRRLAAPGTVDDALALDDEARRLTGPLVPRWTKTAP
jgi:1-deoxy-D-xylulose-5-phosphate reductoisomerase